ncbi:MAG TPA: TonB-dependent receptor [Pyrinomonadaceae bacterium]|nr:TonB-dependent receptor [Pyrinomonadaceae bacterium]
MKNLLIIIVIGLAISLPAVAQSTADADSAITGKVLDAQGASLPGATVTLYGSEGNMRLTTNTDSSGAYRFEKLAPAEYLLEAQAQGFAPASARRVVVRRGQAAALDIPLELTGIRSTVVVIASDTPQSIDEVSKAVTVVDAREIDERDESALTESLRNVPGLRVQQLGGPGSFTSIKTRGLRNEDTAVLIDGIRFRDAAAPQGDASGFLEDLIVTDVSRVEVLRGSGSSLYGSNAIGGVINVVTDEGGGAFHGNALAEGGGLGLFRGRAQFAGGMNQNRFVYSAGVSHLNVADGVDGQDEARNTSGQGRVLFRLTPTTALSGRIYASTSRLQLNNTPEAIGTLPPTGIVNAVPLAPAELLRFESGVPVSQLNVGSATFIPSANDPDNEREANFFAGAVTFSQQPTDAFGYTVNYQALTTHRVTVNGPLGAGFQPFGGSERSDFDGRVHTLNARFNLRTGRANFISGGYEFENENFKNLSFPVNPVENSTVDVTQKSHAFFVQDQLRLLDDRLQLSAAFRAQSFSLDQPVFTPTTSAPYSGLTFTSPPTAYTGDGSIAYLFRSSGTKLRAHAGNGYRAPSLFERFGTFFSSFGFSVFGDPRLRPDRSIAVDGGIDQTFYKNRFRASATYFYTRLQEVIVFDFTGAIDPVTDPFGRFGGFRNTNGGIARGAEFALTATPTSTLNLSTSYTYTKSLQRTPQVPGVLRSLIIPDHMFSFVATQRFGRRILINFDFVASSNYLAPIFDSNTFASRAYRFDGLVKADLGGSYSIPFGETRSLRFFGYVDNLFNRDYYESGFRTPGRTGRAGAMIVF